MYGYGSWGKSVSGWERSHFGGFNRVLNDYPFIDLSYSLDINAGTEIKKDLGSYLGDKLVKIYIAKAKELELLNKLECVEVEKRTYFGTPKKYSSLLLSNDEVFEKICASNTELAPMFVNFKQGIYQTTIDLELPPENEDGDGDGDGQEDQEKKEGDGSGKGDGKGEGEDGDDKEGSGDGDGEGEDDDSKDGEGKGQGKDGEGKDGEGEGEGQPNGGTDTVKPGDKKGKQGKSLREFVSEIGERKPFVAGKKLSRYDGKEAKFVSFTERIRKNSSKIRPYQFSDQERMISENLIKMLDINFDPKSDHVKNLKLGTLDTSKIAEVPAGNLSVYKQVVEEQDTKPFSVCILADMSGSMCQRSRVQSQLTLINSLYLAMRQILPEDKLYIYGHSGQYQPEIYNFYTPYDTDYERNIKFYQKVSWYENYDGPVVEKIHKTIREKTDDRIIFITLSDGLPCGNNYGGDADNKDLKRILEKARRDSFVTVGIGIEADHVDQLYTYSKSIYDLSTIARDASSLINKVVRAEFQ